MPRIYEYTGDAPDSGLDVSIPHDYCRKCYKIEVKLAAFDNAWHGTEHELDADHPDYEETDYLCERCDKRLNGNDDYV